MGKNKIHNFISLKKMWLIIIAIAATFIIFLFLPWKWLFSPLLIIIIFDIKDKNFKRTLIFILGIALSIMSILIFIITHDLYKDYSRRMPFDAAIWRQQKYSSVRLRMINDLLSNHNLIGMDKSEIDLLLGTPDESPFKKKYDYTYSLGINSGYINISKYKFGSQWLCIKFKENKAFEVKILSYIS